MGDRTRQSSPWISVAAVLAALGILLVGEQALPFSAALRQQIGVLTALLIFDGWYLYYGFIGPRRQRNGDFKDSEDSELPSRR